MAGCAGSITEMPNELTENIDVSSPEEIVRLLRQVDAQLFAGWKAYEGLYDPSTISTIKRIAESACEVLQSGSGHVVMSGCGTSGRLAFVVARTFNAHLASLSLPPLFHYLVAGGDAALLKSEEAVEDSWGAGSRDLASLTTEMEKILFVGITCGLSAPYVAGQLDLCMQHRARFTPVLLGFNPTHLARKTPIRDSDKTFHDVVSEMLRDGHLILSPVVGPEAVTGSTRMKGGTATKILLEIIFTLALEKLQHKCLESHTHLTSSPTSLLQAYELTHRHTYTAASCPEQCSSSIARAIEITGKCLQSGGHVYYLGMGTPGVMAIVDASECPPTFGADYGDVRGFIAGGYTTLGNTAGSLTARGSDYELDIDYFTSAILPHLTTNDCIVVVAKGTVAMEAVLPWRSPTPGEARHAYHTMAVLVSTDDMPQVDTSLYDSIVVVTLPWQPLSWYWSRDVSCDLLLEAGVKWVLNAISTGAHILSGKVLGNRMIDLKVSNSKLYSRAIGIIQTFSGCDRNTASQSLLTAIYGDSTTAGETESAGGRCREQMGRNGDSGDGDSGDGDCGDVTEHIARATAMDKVVPVALLLSTGQYSVASAREALSRSPVVRLVLAEHMADNR